MLLHKQFKHITTNKSESIRIDNWPVKMLATVITKLAANPKDCPVERKSTDILKLIFLLPLMQWCQSKFIWWGGGKICS